MKLVLLALMFLTLAARAGPDGNHPGPLPVSQGLTADSLVIVISNEVTQLTDTFRPPPAEGTTGEESSDAVLSNLGLTIQFHHHRRPSRDFWDLTFNGNGPRAGHQVTLEFHSLLQPGRTMFTPSQSGVMDLDVYPTYTPVPYATLGWDSGQAYVLPLISVMDPATDRACTLALPADANLPHLQFEWSEASILRLHLGHRAMGGGSESNLRLLGYNHPADYRAALKAYSDDFPRYFRSPISPPPAAGAFWYHHIHNHPDFASNATRPLRWWCWAKTHRHPCPISPAPQPRKPAHAQRLYLSPPKPSRTSTNPPLRSFPLKEPNSAKSPESPASFSMISK